jgi:hypothetical protein
MGKKVKLTVSLPSELISKKMAEGYRAMATEQKQLAALASEIEHEVIPEW